MGTVVDKALTGVEPCPPRSGKAAPRAGALFEPPAHSIVTSNVPNRRSEKHGGFGGPHRPAHGCRGFLIDVVDYVLARYSEEPERVPVYGEDWIERRGQTLEEARREIPSLQSYRTGPGEKVPDWRRLEASIHGTDVSRQKMRISMMNLVLHGIRRANLKRANVLSEMSGLTEDDVYRR